MKKYYIGPYCSELCINTEWPNNEEDDEDFGRSNTIGYVVSIFCVNTNIETRSLMIIIVKIKNDENDL